MELIPFRAIRDVRALRDRRAERTCQMIDLVLHGEEVSELRGELGMAVEQDPAVRIISLLGGLIVGGEHFVKLLVATSFDPGIRHHTDNSPHCDLPMPCRSALPPRYKSPVTDATVRFIRRATSGTVRP
jgi:hypothetical protein